MMTLFRWAMSRQKCGEDEDGALREAVVYDYAAFLLRSLAAPMCLSQALMIALAARLESGETPPRIPVATEPRN